MIHPDEPVSRLVLGTAQLGMAYGIANQTGKPDQATADAIVRAAWESGIREFDTAQGYQDSEAMLGRALRAIPGADSASVITKFDADADLADKAAIRHSLEGSRVRLGCKRLFGVMLHDEERLDRWNDGLGDRLAALMEEGIVQRLGVSVYSPERALQAIAAEHISLIQIPTNILDRRFENAGVFEAAQSKNKTLYIRSVFLQGLILMGLHELPHTMRHAGPIISKVADLSEQFGLSSMEMAISFVQTAFPTARLVIGVERPRQVRENASMAGKVMPDAQIRTIRKAFSDVAPDLLNPARWPG